MFLRNMLMSQSSAVVTPASDFLTYTHVWNGGAEIQSNEADLEESTSSYINVTTDSANWDLGTDDFTIEIFDIIFESFPDVPGLDDLFRMIGEGRGGSATGPVATGWSLIVNKTGNQLRLNKNDGATGTNRNFGWTASTATTYDIAVSRSGDNIRAYVNGSQIGTTQSVAGVNYDRQESTGLFIGSYQYGSGPTTSYLDGQIAAIKVSSVGLYTGTSYTVPTPESDEDTLYLNTFIGANGSTPTLNTE